ncbi:helix-turn-helix domain-containing protein [Agrobacterium sp. SHOUNA12C]|jgi:transcriptional regulator with XRE-family HTH domain|uniref:Helix-turn-helix transcriptional regulator n=1 Tax=Rhizobium brockwellii TaxID=3019932 RepID=A0ABU3YYQ0_9HYPH|nr:MULTISPECIES: helix-turn-helix transcriptional regulator [Rhizobium]MCJ9719864.1 helix-turn-helix domain-containing protein [Agrobacterium sp. BETTINA12B]MCJ9755201.1 helix-turn-helix domain-containing protein [Agrobacterium sp. SHOUNA12C]MDV4158855.1 helix-turn-helix transcriptional regulator [Rhizobium brockwellii]MDV4183792.1 helix-turn-helix transcriptional regulator [Rhizobium brockwellii]MDV4190782.1 helix-turn-helix transcriptional regulator [Rhizobium brockwellii]
MSQDAIYKSFGRTVAARRKALVMTQSDLANKAGMSRASIASIESGRQNVLLHHVFGLAEALKLERVADLLPEKPKPEGGKMQISDESVTAIGKAQIENIVSQALSRRLGKTGS